MHRRVFSSLLGLHSLNTRSRSPSYSSLTTHSLQTLLHVGWLGTVHVMKALRMLCSCFQITWLSTFYSVPALPYKHFEVPSLTPISEAESHPFMLVALLYSFSQVKALEHYMCSKGPELKGPYQPKPWRDPGDFLAV